MKNEMITLLTDYLAGRKTVEEIGDWLAGTDVEDSVFDESTKDNLGLLDLFVIEVLEGLRSEADVWQLATKIITETAGGQFEIISVQDNNKIAVISVGTASSDITTVTVQPAGWGPISSGGDTPPLRVSVSETGR